MKIYTKTGDKGLTSLVGGQRVKKNHARLEAYGTVDELIANMAYLRDLLENEDIINTIIQAQDDCMVLSAILAKHPDDEHITLPELKKENIVFLENAIDKMEEGLEPLSSFVLPGGHVAVSFCHITRTVCRRAERTILTLNETQTVPDNVIKYINRLSDYFFVLSRLLSKDFKVKEIHWKP